MNEIFKGIPEECFDRSRSTPAKKGYRRWCAAHAGVVNSGQTYEVCSECFKTWHSINRLHREIVEAKPHLAEVPLHTILRTLWAVARKHGK